MTQDDVKNMLAQTFVFGELRHQVANAPAAESNVKKPRPLLTGAE